MTPLDAAKAIGTEIGSQCDACTGSPISGHFNECPILAMPAIVEVLTLVNTLMVSEDGAEPIEVDEHDREIWAFCRRLAVGPHWEGCPWERLRVLASTGVHVR
jgi:hypothetical protein